MLPGGLGSGRGKRGGGPPASSAMAPRYSAEALSVAERLVGDGGTSMRALLGAATDLQRAGPRMRGRVLTEEDFLTSTPRRTWPVPPMGMWNDNGVSSGAPPLRRTATEAGVLAVRDGRPTRRTDRLGMTLVGFVRDGGFNVYPNPERSEA
jgi:hypothetical protein